MWRHQLRPTDILLDAHINPTPSTRSTDPRIILPQPAGAFPCITMSTGADSSAGADSYEASHWNSRTAPALPRTGILATDRLPIAGGSVPAFCRHRPTAASPISPQTL